MQHTQEFPVGLSESFSSVLQVKDNDLENGTAVSPAFTIRYSVPPENLSTADNKLNLHKTVRGEFIVEHSTENGNAVQSGENSVSTPGSKGAFRGQASSCKDTDCVLIYNQDLRMYELHFLGADIQVAPALKTRTKATTPVEYSRQSTSSSSTESSPLSRSTSAALLAKVPTKVRLPTRRKIVSKVKPVNKGSAAKDDHEETAEKISVMTTMKLPKITKLDNAIKTPDAILNDGSAFSSKTSSLSSLSPSLRSTPSSSKSAESTPEHIALTTITDFEDEFGGLADELADDLMEDSEDEIKDNTRLLGTAGGSAEDGDSSEEE